jgi:hypothetical protein
MLHITNGDAAVARLVRAGVAGDILPWRDVLHDGPVPEGLALDDLSRVRARFIADCGWGEFEEVVADFEARDRALGAFREHAEVVLWFEHDLYDQLQLLQLLDWLATEERGATRVTMVCEPEYLGTLPPERVRDLAAARREVTPGQYGLGRAAWRAFRSPDPTTIENLILRDTSDLPFVGPALARHLEQFPSAANGLSRSERQAIEAILAGHITIRSAFQAATHEVEEPVWLGDGVFVWYLEGLAAGRAPLVRFGRETENPIDREVRVTDDGERVLAGEADRVELNGLDRWLGGVRLSGGAAAWRWDERARRLVRAGL